MRSSALKQDLKKVRRGYTLARDALAMLVAALKPKVFDPASYVDGDDLSPERIHAMFTEQIPTAPLTYAAIYVLAAKLAACIRPRYYVKDYDVRSLVQYTAGSVEQRIQMISGMLRDIEVR